MGEQQTTNPLGGLDDDQKQYLRLVAQMMSSKEIGRELNVSPHVVDNRIKLACRKLGANDRKHAARLLNDAENSADDQNQPLVNQSSAFALPKAGSSVSPPVGERSPLPGGASQPLHEDMSLILNERPTPARKTSPLSTLLEVDRENRFSNSTRVAIMAFTVFSIIAALVLILAFVGQLSKMV